MGKEKNSDKVKAENATYRGQAYLGRDEDGTIRIVIENLEKICIDKKKKINKSTPYTARRSFNAAFNDDIDGKQFKIGTERIYILEKRNIKKSKKEVYVFGINSRIKDATLSVELNVIEERLNLFTSIKKNCDKNNIIDLVGGKKNNHLRVSDFFGTYHEVFLPQEELKQDLENKQMNNIERAIAVKISRDRKHEPDETQDSDEVFETRFSNFYLAFFHLSQDKNDNIRVYCRRRKWINSQNKKENVIYIESNSSPYPFDFVKSLFADENETKNTKSSDNIPDKFQNIKKSPDKNIFYLCPDEKKKREEKKYSSLSGQVIQVNYLGGCSIFLMSKKDYSILELLFNARPLRSAYIFISDRFFYFFKEGKIIKEEEIKISTEVKEKLLGNDTKPLEEEEDYRFIKPCSNSWLEELKEHTKHTPQKQICFAVISKLANTKEWRRQFIQEMGRLLDEARNGISYVDKRTTGYSFLYRKLNNETSGLLISPMNQFLDDGKQYETEFFETAFKHQEKMQIVPYDDKTAITVDEGLQPLSIPDRISGILTYVKIPSAGSKKFLAILSFNDNNNVKTTPAALLGSTVNRFFKYRNLRKPFSSICSGEIIYDDNPETQNVLIFRDNGIENTKSRNLLINTLTKHFSFQLDLDSCFVLIRLSHTNFDNSPYLEKKPQSINSNKKTHLIENNKENKKQIVEKKNSNHVPNIKQKPKRKYHEIESKNQEKNNEEKTEKKYKEDEEKISSTNKLIEIKESHYSRKIRKKLDENENEEKNDLWIDENESILGGPGNPSNAAYFMNNLGEQANVVIFTQKTKNRKAMLDLLDEKKIVIPEKKKYDLVLMSDNITQRESNKLYVKIDNDEIKYCTSEMKKIGVIKKDELRQPIPESFQKLESIKSEILKSIEFKEQQSRYYLRTPEERQKFAEDMGLHWLDDPFILKNLFYVAKIPKINGYGLIAAQDIPEGTVLGFYLGKIIQVNSSNKDKFKYTAIIITTRLIKKGEQIGFNYNETRDPSKNNKIYRPLGPHDNEKTIAEIFTDNKKHYQEEYFISDKERKIFNFSAEVNHVLIPTDVSNHDLPLIEKKQDGSLISNNTQRGITPLMWACYQGNTQLVTLLLQQEHISLDRQCEDRRTALHYAVLGEAEIKIKQKIIDLLIQNKAKGYVSDNLNKLPLHYATWPLTKHFAIDQWHDNEVYPGNYRHEPFFEYIDDNDFDSIFNFISCGDCESFEYCLDIANKIDILDETTHKNYDENCIFNEKKTNSDQFLLSIALEKLYNSDTSQNKNRFNNMIVKIQELFSGFDLSLYSNKIVTHKEIKETKHDLSSLSFLNKNSKKLVIKMSDNVLNNLSFTPKPRQLAIKDDNNIIHRLSFTPKTMKKTSY